VGYVVFLLASFAGFAAICAGMKRHYGQVFGRPITPRPAFLLKIGGSGLLAISWAACAYCWGAGMGTVAWVCVLPVAATAVVACLTYSPRLLLRKGGAGAAAVSLLLSLVMLVRSAI
jgi:hypothetical protein